MRVFIVNILIVLVILAGGGAAAYYYNQSANYVTSDNARVDGQPITISAIAAGKLVDWNGEVGKSYNSGDLVGGVQSAGSRANITFPVSGTIVQQSAVPNSFVTPGTPLARAFDLNHLWITANIDETVINQIKVGQAVDVYIDAFPNTTLTGTVDKIGLATAGTFSMLPSSNTNANYTKVTQVIPITIVIEGYKGLGLVPGMNATVRVHI
ncbi:HlyD family secretion protein [Aneurinibacillus tyrosinisolvens]|uniref:HlyD family secretion protein n=1 Tax=Aneurinibacillus tyrosinisolvens TaxID=1443435 RepID=UPI00063F6DC7|nr:efflux RND transporter periplasmic adaptor subunit [Aneurinibacillus tyrosinisolvens]